MEDCSFALPSQLHMSGLSADQSSLQLDEMTLEERSPREPEGLVVDQQEAAQQDFAMESNSISREQKVVVKEFVPTSPDQEKEHGTIRVTEILSSLISSIPTQLSEPSRAPSTVPSVLSSPATKTPGRPSGGKPTTRLPQLSKLPLTERKQLPSRLSSPGSSASRLPGSLSSRKKVRLLTLC